MIKSVIIKNGAVLSKGKSYRKDDVLKLEDAKAERLVKLGVAEFADKDEVVQAAKESSTKENLDELTVSELKKIAKEKGVEVVGSGAKGAVTKVDLLEALAE